MRYELLVDEVVRAVKLESFTTEEHLMFKVGDVVMLKSGGPHMTVAQVFDSNVPEVACIYFQGSPAVIADKLGMLWQPNRHREVFPSDALKNIEERKSIVIPQ